MPLSAIASFGPGNTPLSVNHQGQFVATTISFNLPPGKSLRCHAGDRRHDGADRHAGDDPRQVPGHGAGVPAIAVATSRS